MRKSCHPALIVRCLCTDAYFLSLISIVAGRKLKKVNAFDKKELNKPYYTLLAVAEREEFLSILHNIGAGSNLISVGDGRSINKGNVKPGEFGTKKSATPLMLSIPSANTLANTASLRARAVAAGCLGNDDIDSKMSCSNIASSRDKTTTKLSGGDSFCCTPKLLELLDQLNPTISFAEIRENMNIPLGEVSDVIYYKSESQQLILLAFTVI